VAYTARQTVIQVVIPLHWNLCTGGEGVSTGGCETLSRETFTVEGHEASATQAHNQPAEVACVWAIETAMCATIVSPERESEIYIEPSGSVSCAVYQLLSPAAAAAFIVC